MFAQAEITEEDLSHDYHPAMSYHRRADHMDWKSKTSQRRGSYFGTYTPKSRDRKNFVGREEESITMQTEQLFKSRDYFMRNKVKNKKEGVRGRDFLMRGLRTPEKNTRYYSRDNNKEDEILARRNQKSTLQLLSELDDCERTLRSMNERASSATTSREEDGDRSDFVKSVSNLLSELDEYDQTIRDIDTTFRYENKSPIKEKKKIMGRTRRKRPSLITHREKSKDETRDRIFLAIATGNVRDVKHLVEEFTARHVAYAKDETNHTALQLARNLGRVHILGYLLSELVGEYPQVELST